MQKLAKSLMMSVRKRIKDKNFALPGQGSGTSGKGSGSYPIHDRKHGALALSFAKRNLTRGKLSQEDYNSIVAKVHAKYPTMGKKAAAIIPIKSADVKPKLTPKETKQLLDSDLKRKSQWVNDRVTDTRTLEEAANEEADSMVSDVKYDVNLLALARSMGGIDKLQAYVKAQLLRQAKTCDSTKPFRIKNSGEHSVAIHKVASSLDDAKGMLPYTFRAAFLDELEKNTGG